MGQWWKDYGATLLAGAAALLSFLTLVVTTKARRREWQRDKRLATYSDFVVRTTEFSKTAQKAGLASLKTQPSPALLLEVSEKEARFEAALAAVLVVGPREVARVASLFHDVIGRIHNAARAGSVVALNSTVSNFGRAMNEFIDAAAAALGEQHRQEDVDYDEWLRRPQQPREKWPR